jgi:hypothetical protein
MSRKGFLVLIVKYREEQSKNVKNLIEDVILSINSKYGESKLVYNGFDERIVTALESIMKLTE